MGFYILGTSERIRFANLLKIGVRVVQYGADKRMVFANTVQMRVCIAKAVSVRVRDCYSYNYQYHYYFYYCLILLYYYYYLNCLQKIIIYK